MPDDGHQRFTKPVLYTPPLTVKESENCHYQFVLMLISLN